MSIISEITTLFQTISETAVPKIGISESSYAYNVRKEKKQLISLDEQDDWMEKSTIPNPVCDKIMGLLYTFQNKKEAPKNVTLQPESNAEEVTTNMLVAKGFQFESIKSDRHIYNQRQAPYRHRPTRTRQNAHSKCSCPFFGVGNYTEEELDALLVGLRLEEL